MTTKKTKKTEMPKAAKAVIKSKKPRATNPKEKRTPEAEALLKSLNEETAALRKENTEAAERIGKLLEENMNFRIKADAMLGQILKGLYLMGIDPDVIQRKCQQMFRKAVSAD